MILTRQEKEKLIIDLYNQGKNYKQIAAIARVSVRDIKPVLEKAEKERENELGITTQQVNKGNVNSHQTQRKTDSSQAYRLFSEGKTPLEVAIELNLKEPEATKYYREHWKLKRLHKLDLIYEDIKDDIVQIAKLHRRMKAADIGVEQVINLIKIANNDLPAVEQKYQKLKRDVNMLESRKFKENRSLSQMQDQIYDSKRTLKWLRISCQEEEANIYQLQGERIKLKRLVKQFKDNNEEYLKIKKTIKEGVSNVILDGKGLLRLAFYSLVESMRKDPDKYSYLIYYANNNISSTDSYSGQYPTGYFRNGEYPHQLNSYDSFFEALKSMLLEDADKLYEQLLKEQVNSIITDRAFNSDSSLPPTTLSIHQTYRHR